MSERYSIEAEIYLLLLQHGRFAKFGGLRGPINYLV
jgi:hypothetical protein